MNYQLVLDRVLRLAKGDTTVFDEVKNDVQQTVPALVIAVASILIFAFGGFLWWVFKDYPEKGETFVQSFILGSIFAIALWFVWVVVTYFVITSVYRMTTDVQMLLRTMGYASVPLAIGLLMLIPAIG